MRVAFVLRSEDWSLISCAAVIGITEAYGACIAMPDDRLHFEQHIGAAFDWSSNMPFMKQSLL